MSEGDVLTPGLTDNLVGHFVLESFTFSKFIGTN